MTYNSLTFLQFPMMLMIVAPQRRPIHLCNHEGMNNIIERCRAGDMAGDMAGDRAGDIVGDMAGDRAGQRAGCSRAN